MPVILENFLREYESKLATNARKKKAWEDIRAELYKRRNMRNKDIPNDTTSKDILCGIWDTPDDVSISKTFRDYCRSNSEFIGNGGFPV